MCERKKYKTLQEATDNSGPRTVPYKCQDCDGYHVAPKAAARIHRAAYCAPPIVLAEWVKRHSRRRKQHASLARVQRRERNRQAE